MAFSKLYLTATAAPYAPASIRGAWDKTTDVVAAKALDTTKNGGGAIASVVSAETSTDTTYDVLLYRGVSGPLAAQTIGGNLNVVLGILESNAAADDYWHLHVYVTQGNSDTPRGDLLTDYREASGAGAEWPTTAAGKALNAAQALAALVVSAGDRIVVEIGYVAKNSSATSYSGTLRYGTRVNNVPVADLVLNGTDVTLKAGYLSFSAPITEQTVEARVSQVVLEALTQQDAPEARVSQVVFEALTLVPPPPAEFAYVAQLMLEAITSQESAAIESRVSQLVLESISSRIAQWVNVANWVDIPLDSIKIPAGLVIGSAWTGASDVGVQVRLWNVTDSVSVGESAVITATVPTDATFASILTPGLKRYRLQVTSDTPGVDLFFSGEGLVPA